MIPSSLSKVGVEFSNKSDCSQIHIKCICGCDDFYLFKRRKNTDFLKKEKEYSNEVIDRYGKGFEMMSDENGKVFMIKRNLFGMIIEKSEYNKRNIPHFYNYLSVKCRNCSKEYVLFDERIHGYNACIDNCDITLELGNIKFSNEFHKVDVIVYYSSDIKDDENIKDCSIAFDRIKIYKKNSKKKNKILDIECS